MVHLVKVILLLIALSVPLEAKVAQGNQASELFIIIADGWFDQPKANVLAEKKMKYSQPE